MTHTFYQYKLSCGHTRTVHREVRLGYTLRCYDCPIQLKHNLYPARTVMKRLS